MELFYRKYGEGPPLVILHGLFGSSDNWITIAKSLADTFTVILPDQRNHGRSPHSPEHNYELMRDDLHELVSRIIPGKFFLAGHSMGGKTVIDYALKWPENLNGLLIADMSPFKGGEDDTDDYSYHRSILETMNSMDLKALTTREEAESILKDKGYSERTAGFILKNLHRASDGFEWKINVPALRQNLKNVIRPLDRNNPGNLRVHGFPVIFLRGDRSNYLPESDYKDILKIFPAAEFITVSNAGHWLHADNPDEVVNGFRLLAG